LPSCWGLLLSGTFQPMTKSAIDYPGVGQELFVFHSCSRRQHMIETILREQQGSNIDEANYLVSYKPSSSSSLLVP
jgi:hypothetical protein